MIPFPGSSGKRKAHANQNTAFLNRFAALCLDFRIPDKWSASKRKPNNVGHVSD